MNKTEVMEYARTILDKYNVQDCDLGWDNIRTRAGVCLHYPSGRRVIKFSAPIFERMPEDEQIDTILHEIAHARLPHTYGHDARWQAVFRAMGGSGRKDYRNTQVIRAVAKWQAFCLLSGESLGSRNRLTENVRKGTCKCHNSPVNWVQQR